MRYTIEELIDALLAETMQEAFDDQNSIHNVGSFDSVDEFANNLFHQLRGLHPNSPTTNDVISKLYNELDKFSFYPKSYQLMRQIADLSLNRYKEDPGNYLQIIANALNSDSVNMWLANYKKGIWL